jgi:hypothetical protein
MSRSEELNKIIALCDYAVSSEDTRADWSLDFALFGFALSRLDEYIKEDRYFIFLKSFCDRFAAEKPLLSSRSDAAPVAVVLEMYKRTKNEAYLSFAASVMDSIKKMPETIGLGGSVRTTDMIAFLLADYMFLKYTGDADALDALAREPKKYAASLMDKKDNLFHRSFFKGRIFQNTKIHFPLGRNYPARENILALFALTLVAEGEDYIHREINETITKLTTAINNYRNVDGSYNAFFRNKRKSQSIGFLTDKTARRGAEGGEKDLIFPFDTPNFDPSVASYYAACCLKNASAGIIDAGYFETGKNAYIAAAGSLVKESGAIYMSGGPKKSFIQGVLGMFSRPSGGNNLSGIAGIVFAALEYEKI